MKEELKTTEYIGYRVSRDENQGEKTDGRQVKFYENKPVNLTNHFMRVNLG